MASSIFEAHKAEANELAYSKERFMIEQGPILIIYGRDRREEYYIKMYDARLRGSFNEFPIELQQTFLQLIDNTRGCYMWLKSGGYDLDRKVDVSSMAMLWHRYEVPERHITEMENGLVLSSPE